MAIYGMTFANSLDEDACEKIDTSPRLISIGLNNEFIRNKLANEEAIALLINDGDDLVGVAILELLQMANKRMLYCSAMSSEVDDWRQEMIEFVTPLANIVGAGDVQLYSEFGRNSTDGSGWRSAKLGITKFLEV